MHIKKGIKLHIIISCFMVATVFLTSTILVITSAHANRQSLINSYLDNNQQYAEKLAFDTKDLMFTMQKSIGELAKETGESNKGGWNILVEQFSEENKQYFNSVFIVNNQKTIQSVHPLNSGILSGEKLTSTQTQQALLLQKPLISEPYRATTGRLIVLISSPIFDKSGNYLGFVGGTIYLEEPNVLSRLLNDHFYANGSYVYVVDKTGKLIFHPDKTRLGESVSENEAVQQVLEGRTGSQSIRNSKGQLFLAGYSFVPNAGWGIISQTPDAVVDRPVHDYYLHLVQFAFPFLLLSLLISWVVSIFIAYPLHCLARFSEQVHLDSESKIPFPAIGSAIYEVRQLQLSMKRAVREINRHLKELNIEIQTDALTGLVNRRTFDLILDKWIEKGQFFTIILLDIDYFKKVNDSFGHQTGDAVLKLLSNIMLRISRQEDVCFRYGGEEFGILVKSGDVEMARKIAERLREEVRKTISPTGKSITVSLGLATYPLHAHNSVELVSHADQALYHSKSNGRNCTTVYCVCS
jgi:diguanylate cyclase (GGDEF)-like protein